MRWQRLMGIIGFPCSMGFLSGYCILWSPSWAALQAVCLTSKHFVDSFEDPQALNSSHCTTYQCIEFQNNI